MSELKGIFFNTAGGQSAGFLRLTVMTLLGVLPLYVIAENMIDAGFLYLYYGFSLAAAALSAAIVSGFWNLPNQGLVSLFITRSIVYIFILSALGKLVISQSMNFA